MIEKYQLDIIYKGTFLHIKLNIGLAKKFVQFEVKIKYIFFIFTNNFIEQRIHSPNELFLQPNI